MGLIHRKRRKNYWRRAGGALAATLGGVASGMWLGRRLRAAGAIGRAARSVVGMQGRRKDAGIDLLERGIRRRGTAYARERYGQALSRLVQLYRP